MTRRDRVAELRARALDFRRRGLWRFAAECDRLVAALDAAQPARALPCRSRPADVVPLRLPEPHPTQPEADR